MPWRSGRALSVPGMPSEARPNYGSGTATRNAVAMKPKKHAAPITCAHSASATLTSPNPGDQQRHRDPEEPARLGERGLPRRLDRGLALGQAATEGKPEQRDQRWGEQGPAGQDGHEHGDQGVVRSRRLLHGQAG